MAEHAGGHAEAANQQVETLLRTSGEGTGTVGEEAALLSEGAVRPCGRAGFLGAVAVAVACVVAWLLARLPLRCLQHRLTRECTHVRCVAQQQDGGTATRQKLRVASFAASPCKHHSLWVSGPLRSAGTQLGLAYLLHALPWA